MMNLKDENRLEFLERENEIIDLGDRTEEWETLEKWVNKETST